MKFRDSKYVLSKFHFKLSVKLSQWYNDPWMSEDMANLSELMVNNVLQIIQYLHDLPIVQAIWHLLEKEPPMFKPHDIEHKYFLSIGV